MTPTASDFLLLFLGAVFAAAISGAAGFGGALLLLPILSHAVGTAAAVPLLTMAQLVGNLARVVGGFTEIHWRPVGLFLATAIPGAILGALSFVAIPTSVAVRCIGGAILILVAARISGHLTFSGRHHLVLLIGGGATGILSGLAGSAGPLGAAVFLSLGLPPVAYIASEGVTALTMHAAKIAIYRRHITLTEDAWLLALTLGAGMISGTWLSKHAIRSLSPKRFQQCIAVLLVILALQMVIVG